MHATSSRGPKLKVLDLFAGIGGFSLGLERTSGFETVGFVEIDKNAQKVLQKHWPTVPIYDDIKEFDGKAFYGSVDVITGGFPCQDISLAGKGAGLEGERSGLWWEYHRVIKQVAPKWVIIENVSALRSRGLDQVLWSLSEIGYDAEWHCIPASAVGAPHQRDRIWIIAYPNDQGKSTLSVNDEMALIQTIGDVAHPDSTQRQRGGVPCRVLAEDTNLGSGSWWQAEPDVDRVAYGVPNWTHRLKQLGNAVVPQIPQLIGEALLRHECIHPATYDR